MDSSAMIYSANVWLHFVTRSARRYVDGRQFDFIFFLGLFSHVSTAGATNTKDLGVECRETLFGSTLLRTDFLCTNREALAAARLCLIYPLVTEPYY